MTILKHVFTALLLAFSLSPLLAMLAASFLPNSATDSGLISRHEMNPSLKNHIELFGGDGGIYVELLLNTMVVALSTGVTVVMFSVTFSYLLVVWPHRSGQSNKAMILGAKRVLLCAYVLPAVALVFPYSDLAKKLGAVGSLSAVVAAHILFIFPIALWMMIGFAEAYPPDYEKSAAIDGAGWFLSLSRVAVPRLLPAIANVFAVSIILSWNDVLFSLVLGSSRNRTLAAGVKERLLEGDTTARYSSYSAGVVYTFLIVAVCFLVIQFFLSRETRQDSEKPD